MSSPRQQLNLLHRPASAPCPHSPLPCPVCPLKLKLSTFQWQTASWKGREEVLFIIRRCSPSEHSHFFQATCQNYILRASFMGLPTGPMALASPLSDQGSLASQKGKAQSAPPGPVRRPKPAWQPGLLPLWGDLRQGRKSEEPWGPYWPDKAWRGVSFPPRP